MTATLQRLPALADWRDDEAPVDLSPPGSRAIVRHPDGYYWLGGNGRFQVGPFATAEEALADLPGDDEASVAPDETLPEAEAALGLADWLDPETGLLAEDTHTRIEEH